MVDCSMEGWIAIHLSLCQTTPSLLYCNSVAVDTHHIYNHCTRMNTRKKMYTTGYILIDEVGDIYIYLYTLHGNLHEKNRGREMKVEFVRV